MVEKTMSSGWWPSLFDPLRQMGRQVADWFAPRSEASAADNAYQVRVELPGVKAEDVDVQLHEGMLTVRGEKRAEREEKGKSYFFSEVEYGSFERSFRMPPDADADKVKAGFADGVLTITVSRRTPAPGASRKIEIGKG